MVQARVGGAPVGTVVTGLRHVNHDVDVTETPRFVPLHLINVTLKLNRHHATRNTRHPNTDVDVATGICVPRPSATTVAASCQSPNNLPINPQPVFFTVTTAHAPTPPRDLAPFRDGQTRMISQRSTKVRADLPDIVAPRAVHGASHLRVTPAAVQHLFHTQSIAAGYAVTALAIVATNRVHASTMVQARVGGAPVGTVVTR